MERRITHGQLRDNTWAITTNGILLNDEIIQFCMDNEGTLYVSLDGPQGIHDANRVFPDGRGSYDIVATNLHKIRRYNEKYYSSKVFLMVTLSPCSDLVKLQNFLAHSDLARVASVMVNQVSPDHTTYFDEMGNTEVENFQRQYDRLFMTYCDAAIQGKVGCREPELRLAEYTCNRIMLRLYNRGMTTLGPDITLALPPAVCLPGFKRFFVTTQGEFYLCEKCSHTSEPFCIGDIERGIQLDRMTRLFKDYAELSDCSNCWAFRLCGVCFVMGVGDNGLSGSNKVDACERAKGWLDRTLTQLCSIMEKNAGAFQLLDTDVEDHDLKAYRELLACVSARKAAGASAEALPVHSHVERHIYLFRL